MAAKKVVKKNDVKKQSFDVLTEVLREWSGKIGQQFYIKTVGFDHEFAKVTLNGIRHEIYGSTEHTSGGAEVLASVTYENDDRGIVGMLGTSTVQVAALLSVEQITDFIREHIIDTVKVTVTLKK
jgi:hypothetical protein